MERYGIDADLSRRPHGLYTWSDASLPALRKELAAARDAGIVGAQLHTADELTAAGEKPLPFVELPASMGVKAVLVRHYDDTRSQIVANRMIDDRCFCSSEHWQVHLTLAEPAAHAERFNVATAYTSTPASHCISALSSLSFLVTSS